MDEFALHLNRVSRITVFLLAGGLMCWAFLDQWRPYFAGFMVGATVSLINAHYTAWKIRQLGELAVSGNSGKRVNLGFLTRASTSLLAVLLAVRAPDIEFSTTLASLFLTQILSVSVGIYMNIKYQKNK